MSTCQDNKDSLKLKRKDSLPSSKSLWPENQQNNKKKLLDIKPPLKTFKDNFWTKNHGKKDKKKELKEDNKDNQDHQEDQDKKEDQDKTEVVETILEEVREEEEEEEID